MNNNFFVEKLNFNFANQPNDFEVYDFTNRIGIDAVHFSGKFPAVFFKKVNCFNNETIKEIVEIHRKIWNNSSVVFLYVVSSVEIRIYNCNDSPVFLNKEALNEEKELQEREIITCKNDDKNKLVQLSQIFSSIGIDSGKIWLSKYSKKIKLQTKVDHYLVDSLLKLAQQLHKDIKDDNIIHSVLMRSIFVMYLQDRKAIPKEIWDEIGDNDFIKILDNHEKTYQLFIEIEKHFNGNVFSISHEEIKHVRIEHLKLIKSCLIDGNIDLQQQRLFEWRLFDFSFIRIELLSEIYENFLNVFEPLSKKQTGTYYTPPSLVELVLDEVLPKGETNFKLKILDPACGSGIFLAQAYKRIVQNWKIKNSSNKLDFATLSEIMKNSIYGVEINNKSIKVTAFSLYLALLDFLEPRDVWLKNNETFPYLINEVDSGKDIINKGKNLFCADTIADNDAFEKNEYDIIVGNPPFGVKNLPSTIIKYCKRYSFDKQFVIPFIHKSINLAPNGKIALLFNTKILTNTSKRAQNFRKWLFSNYVEKIFNLSILRKAPKNFGGHLFFSAVAPVSIIFFQKVPPKTPKPTIEYWAPKTYIKSNVVEGVIIDYTDIKYIPREICQQSDTKIWKIAQWGTLSDFYLIEKNKSSNLQDYFDKSNYKYGVGLESSEPLNIQNSYIKTIPHINVEKIFPYYTLQSKTNRIDQQMFRRSGDIEAYKAPHVIFKEGISTVSCHQIKEKRLFASYIDYECSFYKGLVGIHSENVQNIKLLTAYLNSSFCLYFMFLTASSWAIERDVVKYNEVFALPNILDTDQQISQKIIELVDKKIDNIKNDKNFDEKIDKQINIEVFKLLNLTPKEQILVTDTIKFTISLFYEGEKSIALKPIDSLNPETFEYANILCNEINEFIISKNYKINARIYKVSPYIPLCMVALKFVSPSQIAPRPEIIDSEIEFQSFLNIINKYTIEQYAQNIYIRKQIRYYDKDTIFIIKPNQKRFWTRSQGIDDAYSIINEIAMSK